jgi:lysozyme
MMNKMSNMDVPRGTLSQGIMPMTPPLIPRMSPELKFQLRKILVHHEGKESKPYLDQFGNCTIAIGRNLTSNGLHENEIDLMFDNDVAYFWRKWHEEFSWFVALNDARKIALLDMSYMGWQNILEFKNMLACLAKRDFNGAADEILDSLYHKQVGKRAEELAEIIRTGALA